MKEKFNDYIKNPDSRRILFNVLLSSNFREIV